MVAPGRAAYGSWCLFALALLLAAASWPRPLAAAAPPAVPGEYRVATWNIRSGDGRCPIGLTCAFSDETQNCTDATAPRNAWGVGVPQAVLRDLQLDASVIALGLQEAWNCGVPANVKGALGWAYASIDYNGTALVARYGISGALQIKLLSGPGEEQAYALGADVCVDAACSATLRVYTTHLVYNTEDDHVGDTAILAQAQGLVAWINSQPHADRHVLAGDFNAFEREAEVSFKCELTFDYRAPQYLRSTGYSDAWQALHGTAPGMTATLNKNGCGAPNGAAWKRIDYGFLKGLAPITSSLFAVVPVNTAAPSDHYGLLTGFTGPTDPVASGSSDSSALMTLPAGEILLRAADDAHPRITGRWAVTADATANGGRKWLNADLGEAKIATALASPANYFEVKFSAPANVAYHLWLRMRAQRDDYTNDSVSVQFNDSATLGGTPAFRIGTTDAMAVVLEEGPNAGLSGWGWADNAYGGLGAAFTFQQSGVHTIRIQQREDGASVDEILLSPSAYLQRPPGAAKQDSTMFKATQVPQ